MMISRFNSLDKIANFQGPLLIAHGTDDKLIPFKHGEKLFAAANEPKQLIPIQGADHNFSATPEYKSKLDGFIASLEASD